MLLAIDSATHSVCLEMYIYAASAIGDRFRAALTRAQQRGVRVRVLLDAFGSLTLPTSYWTQLADAGGEFRWFNPLSLRRLGYRDHRKLLVCDDRVAFLGGFNIAPEYEGDGVSAGWRDLGLQVGSPLAAALAQSFDVQFARADFQHARFARLRQLAPHARVTTEDGELFLSGPGRGPSLLRAAIVLDLCSAREVRVMSAYFLPTVRIRRELTRVARRGGRVQLILAACSDVPLSQLASQSLYAGLMRAGVEIYEYQPQVLHAKLLLIDRLAYVGSANLDARSLHINYELLVRVREPELIQEAHSSFDEDLRRSQRVDPTTWRRSRSVWRRLKERWAHFLLARVDTYMARRQLQTLMR
jgi:cardiolipin synthase